MNPIEDTKIQQAMEVLKRVQKLSKRFPQHIFYLDTYQNCREAGFCIRGSYFFHKNQKPYFGGEMYLAFSECRNSDSIVVMYDEIMEGEVRRNLVNGFHGNLPTDEAYENRESFGCGEYDVAAKHIITLLKSFVKRAKAIATKNAEKESA